VDGQAFRWNGPLDAKSSTLEPGRHYQDIMVALVKDWRNNRGPLILAPGKHTVRFVFLPEAADQGLAVRVVSNPVEIEIFAADAGR